MRVSKGRTVTLRSARSARLEGLLRNVARFACNILVMLRDAMLYIAPQHDRNLRIAPQHDRYLCIAPQDDRNLCIATRNRPTRTG